MKKTLIITLDYPPVVGGIANVARDMAHLFDIGDVVVLAPRAPQGSIVPDDESYKVYRLPLLFPRPIWPRWLRLFFHAYRIVRQEHIGRIIIHHVLPSGSAAWILRRILKISYIVFFHGTDVIVGSSSLWKRLLVSRIAGGAERLVFNSEWLRNRFAEIYPDLENKTAQFAPCPSEDFFERPDAAAVAILREQYALSSRKVILSVGRLVDGKGFPHLVRILPAILRYVPNAVLLIVGDGPKRADLISLTQKLRLQNVVRFLGEWPSERMPLLYALADAFVLLTHPDHGAEESFGLVFLEAAAVGVPAVAGRSGGVAEAVLDGETGFIVNAYNDKKMVEVITLVLSDREFAGGLAERARLRAEREFRWDQRKETLKHLLG